MGGGLPAYEFDEDNNRYVSAHHPFTAPKDEHIALMDTDPSQVKAKATTAVMNGWELGGGSVRIHNPELQQKPSIQGAGHFAGRPARQVWLPVGRRNTTRRRWAASPSVWIAQ